MAPQARNSKPIFKTSSPFTDATWPAISHDDREVILDLLCNLLAPLGDHRKTYIHPSKGKKRNRTPKDGQNASSDDTPPPPPEIGKHILIGINSVTRHLEALAASHAPSRTSAAFANSQNHGGISDKESNYPPLSMVFITHPNPSTSPAHAHFPTLVHLSTLKSIPSSSPKATHATRLIPLPTTADARLASNLHIPRVGAIGIYEDAPGAKALEDFVREKVGVTECKWVDEAIKAEWMGLNVKNEAGTVGKEGNGKKKQEQQQPQIKAQGKERVTD